jgi:hypothetical protein
MRARIYAVHPRRDVWCGPNVVHAFSRTRLGHSPGLERQLRSWKQNLHRGDIPVRHGSLLSNDAWRRKVWCRSRSLPSTQFRRRKLELGPGRLNRLIPLHDVGKRGKNFWRLRRRFRLDERLPWVCCPRRRGENDLPGMICVCSSGWQGLVWLAWRAWLRRFLGSGCRRKQRQITSRRVPCHLDPRILSLRLWPRSKPQPKWHVDVEDDDVPQGRS